MYRSRYGRGAARELHLAKPYHATLLMEFIDRAKGSRPIGNFNLSALTGNRDEPEDTKLIMLLDFYTYTELYYLHDYRPGSRGINH